MSNIAFEKVSYETFISSIKCTAHIYNSDIKDTLLYDLWDNIKLPKRSTAGSAGYDFFLPFELSLSQGQSVVIPTGIKCKLPMDKVLMLYPRSGLGFKHRLMLSNTIPVIDADYYNNEDNEGHIMIKLYYAGHDDGNIEWKLGISSNGNSHKVFYTPVTKEVLEDKNRTIYLASGKAFAQGVILDYYTTDDDNTDGIRIGGLGSTDKK